MLITVEVMRESNIKLGKASDRKIIEHIKKLDGFIDIVEIKDSQQNRYSIQGVDKLQNDINMILGIDYILVMNTKQGYQTYYIDTKGFTYKPIHNGALTDGIVETILLQVSKLYGGRWYKGWANNSEHWTTHILILINDHIYYMNYKRLVSYCNDFLQANDDTIEFDKKYGNYEYCIKASIEDLKVKGVITDIRRL